MAKWLPTPLFRSTSRPAVCVPFDASSRSAVNQIARSLTLSTISLLSLKDLATFVVENAQSYRSRRPRDIRGGDDSCRHIRYPNLDFPQSCRSAIRRRANKLDSERVRRGSG